MGNAIVCVRDCLGLPPQQVVCNACKGTGKCAACDGTGHLQSREKAVLRNEKRKTVSGAMVPETITVMIKEEQVCDTCGGGIQSFRGTLTSNDRPGISPIKGRNGDGRCRKCRGTGCLLVWYH